MAELGFLDLPFFDDDHRAFRRELAAWARSEIAPLEGSEGNIDETAALTRTLVRKLGEAGWLRYVVPTPFGGAHRALEVRILCLARETLAQVMGLAEYAFAMQGLGSASISLFGSTELKQAYLPAVSNGTGIAAFALTEPGAGSDVASIAATAVAEGGVYLLDGTKSFVSNAGIADHYVLFARTGDTGARGLSAFVVDADTPGLEVSERLTLMAPHPIGSLRLTECRVPKSHLLGAPGEGFPIAMATLDIFRATVGAAALGFARRAFDEALDFTLAREAFGRPIAEYQLTREKIADMATNIDSSALLVYRAAWLRDVKADRISREASMAKMHATEAAQLVIDTALQLHGGRGVVRGEVVERLYREIRALRIYEGTTDIQKLIIAKDVVNARRQADAPPAAKRGVMA